ncbi:hypothetical protein FHQ18_07615 [Deferribacter autotrophicus]|uniref:Uncharacterized protein n=1 Tax=Deferribacter autotrophicus TaxID=500465 RepID=A0A5A8F2T0_9BACT|nr:hypothetical protein [Deferribacter autotrophicus]KAA0258252.1 hypothetical protein FHQ18_07615 [Deferribacter autotrophicus]
MKKDFKKFKEHDDLDRRTNNLKEFKKLAEFLKDFRNDDEEPELTAIKMEEFFERKWKELN